MFILKDRKSKKNVCLDLFEEREKKRRKNPLLY